MHQCGAPRSPKNGIAFRDSFRPSIPKFTPKRPSATSLIAADFCLERRCIQVDPRKAQARLLLATGNRSMATETLLPVSLGAVFGLGPV